MALWNNQLDYQILVYLMGNLTHQNSQQVDWALQTLYIIFEDVRFDS